MRSRSSRSRTVRATAAAAVVLAGTATATGAVVPSADGQTFELYSDGNDVQAVEEVVLTDDAAYVSSKPLYDGWVRSIYVRTITVDADVTVLGPLTLAGRSAGVGELAVHEGTLAYSRAVDGRLVLRATDGTEALPEWGDHPGLAHGVVAMSDGWVAGVGDIWDRDVTLFDRTTGEAFDLASLVEVPGGFGPAQVVGVELSDERAVFTLWAQGDDRGHYQGLYTVGLGPTGPEGDVSVLTAGAYEPGVEELLLGLVALDGDRVVWDETPCTATCRPGTLRWLDAPYTGTPGVLEYDADWYVASVADGAVAFYRQERGSSIEAHVVDWYDLAGDHATPVRTVEVPGAVHALTSRYVAFTDGRDVGLAALDGSPVTGDHVPPPPLRPFDDVHDNDPFADEISWLYDRGVVGGFPDGTFRNLASVSREAMAAFLYRAVNEGGEAPACGEAPFTDVAVSHPFCGEIAWLAGAGISTGWADGTFRPGEPVTREAMAAFLYRLAEGEDAPSCTDAPFADVSTGHPFCGAIAWMAEAGVSTGWPDETFRAGLTIERQAMAAFLFRFIDGGHVPTP